MTPSETTIASLFRAACAAEIAALKPGNVHAYADGHGMTQADFLRSAAVAAAPLCRAGATLGARILQAVTATRAAVGQNTNLGILLLCAPLAMAAARAAARGGALRDTVGAVLREADIADADAVFRAIVIASPGGLGSAPAHDVRGRATVTLRAAMAAAAERDAIARQYTDDYRDVFATGVATYAASLRDGRSAAWATSAAYLAFLAAIPDSHVQRRHGAAVAGEVTRDAAKWQRRLADAAAPERLVPDLLAWDADLKRRGINPGTSADLTVASIFAHDLGHVLQSDGMNG